VLMLLWSGTVSFVLPLVSSPPPRLHMQSIAAGADELRGGATSRAAPSQRDELGSRRRIIQPVGVVAPLQNLH
jgi:hypothetical protein